MSSRVDGYADHEPACLRQGADGEEICLRPESPRLLLEDESPHACDLTPSLLCLPRNPRSAPAPHRVRSKGVCQAYGACGVQQAQGDCGVQQAQGDCRVEGAHLPSGRFRRGAGGGEGGERAGGAGGAEPAVGGGDPPAGRDDAVAGERHAGRHSEGPPQDLRYVGGGGGARGGGRAAGGGR